MNQKKRKNEGSVMPITSSHVYSTYVQRKGKDRMYIIFCLHLQLRYFDSTKLKTICCIQMTLTIVFKFVN